MNSVIKDRIDKIGQGIVPEGYKETKVGIIPNDWEVRKLSEISKIVSGGTPSTTNPDYWDGEIAWATPTDITGNGKFINDTSRKITDKGLKISSANLLPINSILMTSRATIGERSINSVPMATNQGFKSFICKDNSNYEYLYYLLEILKKKIIRMSSGSTFLEISKKDIDIIELAKPPLQEQEKIADILSTWDTAIENIEKLIKEKEVQRTGLMQQLLTGETRLPGFEEQWNIKRMGQISNIYRGASPRPISDKKWFDEHSGIGWVRISDVSNSDKYLDRTEQYLSKEGIEKSRFVEKNNIIMSICATIGKPIITKLDVCIHDGFVVYQNPLVNKMFLYYYLKYIENKWMRYGQTGSQMNLNIGIVSNETIRVPPLPEQKAIAEILSTADKEIELLKQLLENKKEEKKGLMQLLLTGIVRV